MVDWKSLEDTASFAVVAAAAVSLAVLVAWYRLRKRQLEMAAFSGDDQAARVLGESLARCAAHPDIVKEVMTAFARMDSAGKRSLASAVAGLLAATDLGYPQNLGPAAQRIRAIVAGLAERGRLSDGGEEARRAGGERTGEEGYVAEEHRRPT
jgi:hypothetical protein